MRSLTRGAPSGHASIGWQSPKHQTFFRNSLTTDNLIGVRSHTGRPNLAAHLLVMRALCASLNLLDVLAEDDSYTIEVQHTLHVCSGEDAFDDGVPLISLDHIWWVWPVA
jgi:hypothetical protein